MAAQNSEYEKVPVIEIGDNDITTTSEPSYGYGVRHVQAFIFFLTLLVGYLARAHLGVSVVAMTYTPSLIHQPTDEAENVILDSDKTLEQRDDDNLEETRIANMNEPYSNKSVEVHGLNTNVRNISKADQDWDNHTDRRVINEKVNVTSDENGIYKKYMWSKPIQEMVLTSFYLGYCILQYVMSMLAQRYGGKLPLQIGLLVNAIVSVATPWLAFWVKAVPLKKIIVNDDARHSLSLAKEEFEISKDKGGWKAVCFCRILQGVSQGGFYPSIQTLLAQWVPPNERAKLASFVYAGTTLGTIVAFQLSGVLAASRWGWPSIFWGTGILCFLTFIILTLFGAATPGDHKSISEEEVKYITHTMTNVEKKKPRVPLKAALSSKPVWATFCTHIGSTVAFLFIFMQVPSYIHYSLGVNVKNSGLFSSLPYVASFFAAIFYGIFSDFLTNRNFISVKTARILFNTYAQVGTAVCLVAVAYTKSVGLAISLLVIVQVTFVAIHVGWMVNYIDLSSNFSGALVALGNTLMNMFTLTLPVLVSNIVTDVTNQTQWRVMFYLMAGFALITNAIFVVFMSADRQPWDDPDYEKAKSDEIDMEKLKKETR